MKNLIRALVLMLALGFNALCATAQDTDDTTNLPLLERFAFGGTGFSGAISEGQIRFDEVLKSPDAIAQFEQWYKHGTPTLRAYALVGLHALSPERYKQLKAEMQAPDRMFEQFDLQSGCMVMQASFAALFQMIENGNYKRYTESTTQIPSISTPDDR